MSPPRIAFAVSGLPATKGSTRSFRHSVTGKLTTTADNRRLPAWEGRIRRAARDAMGRSPFIAKGEPALLAQGPVRLELVFSLPRPLAHFVGERREGGRLRAKAPHFHDRLPDLDKLTRAVGDAIVRARVIHDDGQISQFHATKTWAAQGQEPGVAVVVEQLEEGPP